jgi:hypothetical protein
MLRLLEIGRVLACIVHILAESKNPVLRLPKLREFSWNAALFVICIALFNWKLRSLLSLQPKTNPGVALRVPCKWQALPCLKNIYRKIACTLKALDYFSIKNPLYSLG